MYKLFITINFLVYVAIQKIYMKKILFLFFFFLHIK